MEIIRAEAIHLGDAAFLFDKYRQFYKQESDVEGAVKFLEERTRNNESVIFLAFADKRPVGFMQLYPTFSSISIQRAWLLNDLFVEESYRNLGVATTLLNAADDFGRDSKAKFLMLQTGNQNFVAQRLYENNGWRTESDLFYSFDLVGPKNLKPAKLPASIKK
jgi:GNAT superfamily N-acetyltransferase